MVDAEEVLGWEKEHPQPFDRDAYQGTYQDPHDTPEEPHVGAHPAPWPTKAWNIWVTMGRSVRWVFPVISFRRGMTFSS